jgi:hypothetical protein
MSNGSPTLVISGIVHLRSNALDSTILKICRRSDLNQQEVTGIDVLFAH